MKRIVFKLLLFLLAGAIINVAVAWCCAVLVSLSPWKTDKTNPQWAASLGWKPPFPHERTSIRRGCGVEYQWAGNGHRKVDDDLALIATASTVCAGWPIHSMVGHEQITIDARRGTGMPIVRFIKASGLPDLSQSDSLRQRMVAEELGRSALPLPSALFKSNPALQGRRLPLMPLWPGFAINTIFYAAILSVLFAVPGYIKRRQRIKRGLCAHCAYPVGSNEKCTECGNCRCILPD